MFVLSRGVFLFLVFFFFVDVLQTGLHSAVNFYRLPKFYCNVDKEVMEYFARFRPFPNHPAVHPHDSPANNQHVFFANASACGLLLLNAFTVCTEHLKYLLSVNREPRDVTMDLLVFSLTSIIDIDPTSTRLVFLPVSCSSACTSQ
jgi:hypothetical protein